jgi:hypothetical protein
MRKWILFMLTALALTACATAATEAPPLPTVAATMPPDLTQTTISQQTGQLPDATDPPTLVPPTDIPQPTVDSGTTTGLLLTPVIPTAVPAGVTPVLPTLEATLDIQQVIGMLPPPGTVVVPATEEVINPLDAASPFFSIYYRETGGPSNSQLEIEIFGDGRVIRNGTASSISAETVTELNQLIRDVKFFSIQGQFTQPGGASSDAYSYLVRVELETGSASRIEAHDRLTPPELLRLFSRLRTIGL